MRVSVRYGAAIGLGAIAALEAAYGLWFAPMVGLAIAIDPTRFGWGSAIGGGVVGLALGILALVVALGTAVSALGVASGHPAGWWIGMVVSVAWVFSGCAPVALVAVAVLLLPEVREIAFPPSPGEG